MTRRHSAVPPWATVTVLSLCGMVAALQFTLVIPLLPELPTLLAISEENASWLVTATLLSAAVSTPIVTKMADMYGKRRMLLVALGVLTLGSLICAVGADSFPALIAGRALQGFASSLIAIGISILRDELPPERISAAVALMSATLGIGSALGLPLAGILTNLFGWQSIFWFTGVVAALLILGLLLLVPESPLRTPGRFDIVGALLLSLALVALLLPVTKGAIWGWSSPAVLALGALGALILAIWVPYELRVNQPMVDLRTAARRPVLLTNAASLFVGFAMFVNMLVTTRLLQLPDSTGYGLGLSVFATGVAMVPSGLAMVAVAPLAGRMLDHWGGRRTLMLGTAIMMATYLGRIFFSGNLLEIVIGSTLVGVGTAIAFAAMPTLIMASVPITETASANGLNSLVRSVGTSMASAVVVMVLTATGTAVGGEPVPSEFGLQLVLWLAVAATAVALVLVWFVPATAPAGAVGRQAERGVETVVSGRLLQPDLSRMTRQAIVTVFDLQGAQLDWARADREGRYAVALPGPGSYVVVANAQGWAPAAHVLWFGGDTSEQSLILEQELTVSGQVTIGGNPCPSAVVSLTAAEGEQIGTTTCDAEGRYRFPLPPIGRYLLTAIEPTSGLARARKTLLTVQSATVDLELTEAADAASSGPSPAR